MSTGQVLVVGAGFAGAVTARELAEGGHPVLVIDRRSHVGGNAFDELDAHGIRVHRYGPHIFHTNAGRIFAYLSQFTQWRSYEHRVLSFVDGRLFPFPINRTTINQLYGLNLDEEGVRSFLESVREPKDKVRTSEDVVLNSVGRDLYRRFFQGYTLKQWGMDASRLAAGVAARIPVRTNGDDRYFTDAFQAMPADGYSSLFGKLLDHPLIEVELGTDYFSIRERLRWKHVVYTGQLDSYFSACFGPLPYRSLSFEHVHLPSVTRFQDAGTVNYPNDHQFTRITEFKHLTGQIHSGTSIVREYPQDEGEPYYPVPRVENDLLFRRYDALARAEPNVTFVGRLAQYRYYNMDQVVAAALTASKRLLEQLQ